jgi:hypothetical protein
MPDKPFDLVGFIMDFESGEVSPARLLEGFGHLVKTGQAWSLQGFYGRTAAGLIEAGYLTRTGTITPAGREVADA